MKVVQFIHPMFLAALGLHASLLFVPLGGDAEPELLEEDVPLAELTGDASKAASNPTPERLPVPDPNVQTSAAKPAQIQAKPASPATIVQPRPVPVKVTPSAGVAAKPAQTTATGALAASGSGSSSVGDAIRNAAGGDNSAGGSSGSNTGSNSSNSSQRSGNVTTPVVSSAPQQPSSFIPDLTADEGADEAAGSETADTQNSAADSISDGGATVPVENTRLNELIAALPEEAGVPNFLEEAVLALQDALLYRPEEITNESAEQMRENWVDSISRQATSDTDSLVRAEPKENDSLTLAYPMDSSVLREGRSLDVCLDEDPSNVEIGLLFDSEGELFIKPTVLRSTGYKALDMEAIAMLQAEENLPSDRSNQAYIFEIEVDYDKEACIDP